jgi:antitoxin component YwqK of YwqJK toxin-antitoxin module
MLSLEEIFSKKPQNAAYRQTITQSYTFDTLISRWDIYYDCYGNEIWNICTSQVLNLQDTDFALSEDSPYHAKTFYMYNEDGKIVKRTIYSMGTVRETKFEYNNDNTISRKIEFEDGSEASYSTFEYDEHHNPIKEHVFCDGNYLYTDEYEYSYDEYDRITYKVWKSRLFTESIHHYWYEYDGHGNVIMEKEFVDGSDFPSHNKMYYDENNRLIKKGSYSDNELKSEDIYQYEFYD